MNSVGGFFGKTVPAWVICTTLAGTAVGHHLYIIPERFQVASIETVTTELRASQRIGEPLVSEVFRPETVSIGFHHESGAHEASAHDAGSFPKSEIRPTRVQEALLYSKDGVIPILNLRADGKRMVGSARISAAGHYIASVVMTSRAPSVRLPAREFNDYLQTEGLTDVMQWRITNGESSKEGWERWAKYSKAILLAASPDEGFKRAIGHPLELIPEDDPYSLRPGDSIRVRVLLRGSPAGGLDVHATWTTPKGPRTQSIGRTDLQGRITVPLTASGPWRLHTIHMEHCADRTAADWESFWATLTFQIRK